MEFLVLLILQVINSSWYPIVSFIGRWATSSYYCTQGPTSESTYFDIKIFHGKWW